MSIKTPLGVYKKYIQEKRKNVKMMTLCWNVTLMGMMLAAKYQRDHKCPMPYNAMIDFCTKEYEKLREHIE